MKSMKHCILFLFTCFLALLCLTGCEDDQIEQHYHFYGEWQTTKAATCTESGTQTKYCSCGEKQEEVIPPLEHNYEEIAHTDVTCTQNGSQTFFCKRCSQEYTKTLYATGHAWVDATCESAKHCSRCAETEGDPLGHNYQNGACTRCKQEKIGKITVSNTLPCTLQYYGYCYFTISEISCRFYKDKYNYKYISTEMTLTKIYDVGGEKGHEWMNFYCDVYSAGEFLETIHIRSTDFKDQFFVGTTKTVTISTSVSNLDISQDYTVELRSCY